MNGGYFNQDGDIQFNGPATYSRPGSSGSGTMPINNDQITARFTALFANARTPQEQAAIRAQYAQAMQEAASPSSSASAYDAQFGAAAQQRAQEEAARRREAEFAYQLEQRRNAAADTRTQGQWEQGQQNRRNDPAFSYMSNPAYGSALLRGAVDAGNRGDLLGNNPAYRPNPYMAMRGAFGGDPFGGSWGAQGGSGQQKPQTQPIWNGGTFNTQDQDMIRNYLSRLMGGQ